MTAQLQVAMMETARTNLNELARVRKELAVVRKVHANLGETARFVNKGRITRLEKAERLALAAVMASGVDLGV